MRNRPRTVIWVQDLYSLGVKETNQGGATTARAMQAIESRTLKSADLVVVIHSRFATYVENVLGVEPARIKVVRNWTHLPQMLETDLPSLRAELGWHHDDTVVLHAGNMGSKQGLGNVIAAARLAEEQGARVMFVLLGDGNQRKNLEDSAVGLARI